MLRLLDKLGEAKLLERFISGVVSQQYDGSENEALPKNVRLLGAKRTGALFSKLARENMPVFHRGCVDLLRRVISELGEKLTAEWTTALRGVAREIVEALPNLKPAADPYTGADWQRTQKAKPVDAAMAADLLDALRALDAAALRAEAAGAIAANSSIFDPVAVVAPALETLRSRERKGFGADTEAARLWKHAAEGLAAGGDDFLRVRRLP